MNEVIEMPYDYYDYLTEQRNDEKFTEISEKIRQNLWNDSFDFRLSQKWLKIEDKIRIKLYLLLRYN